jgi:hypothetical protein
VAYRFDIQHHANGSITATNAGHSANSERGLARKLVEAGLPDGPIEAGRPGCRDYTVASLHHFAAGTLSEGEKGFQRGIYAPYPPREMHPALQHAISRRVEAVKNGVSGNLATPAPEGVQKAAGEALNGG